MVKTGHLFIRATQAMTGHWKVATYFKYDKISQLLSAMSIISLLDPINPILPFWDRESF